VYRVQDGALYVQSFPPHEEHPDAKHAALGQRFTKSVQNKLFQRAKQYGASVDATLAARVVNESRGVATPVSTATLDYDSYLASARLVENVIPVGATWDGSDRPIPIHADATVPVTGAAGGG
jgi:hypothetical protein